MKKIKMVVVVSLLCMVFGGGQLASASQIRWSADHLDDWSKVSNTGTLIEACNFGGGPTTTVNGVKFTSIAAGGNGTYIKTPASLTGYNYNTAYYTGPLTNPAGDALFDYMSYGSSGFTYTLSGLTVGKTYMVQFLHSDDRTTAAWYQVFDLGTATEFGDAVTTSHNANVDPLIVTGTFIANAATQTFTTNTNGGPDWHCSAIQLREIPEFRALAWSADHIDDWSKVSNAGTLIEACNFGGGPTTTVNGVEFTSITAGGNGTYINTPASSTGYNYNTAYYTGTLTDGDDLFDYISYGYSGFTYTLSGLTVGKTYMVQFLHSEDRTTADWYHVFDKGTATEFGDAVTTSCNGEVDPLIVTGVFIAYDTTQTFTTHTNGGSNAWHCSAIQLREIPEPEGIYVAPWGLDSSPGTISWPKATLQGAAAAAAQYKQAIGLPEGGLNVYFRGGTYLFDSKTFLTAADSGLPGKPVIYQSYPGETARITGAVQLDPSQFSLVTSSDPIWSRVNSAAQGNLYQMDLSSYGLAYGTPTSNPTELVFNQEVMQLGRWPNTSYELTVSPTDSNVFPGDYNNDPSVNSFFTYTGTQPSNWLSASDAYVSGHFNNGYFLSIASIDSIDTGSKKITLSENPLNRGVMSDKAWYAFNLLEEIDSAGEYYIDVANEILYFWPPAALAGSELLISQTANLLECRAQNIQFKDLIFESSRGRAVLITQTNNVTLDGCTVRNTGGEALSLSAVTNSTVKNCSIYDTGLLGLNISECGSTINLTDPNVLIANNYLARSGRFKSGFLYTPLVQVHSNSTGVTIRNNHLEDSLDMGLYVNGNNHLVEYNRLERCAYDCSDLGASYSGGMWTGMQGCVFRYNEVRDSVSTLVGTYSSPGLHGFYVDGLGSGPTFYGNIVYNVDDHAFLNNGGRDFVYSNNVIADCDTAYFMQNLCRLFSCEQLLPPLLAVNYNVPGSAWYNTFPQLLDIPSDCSDPATFDYYRNARNCSLDTSIAWNTLKFTSDHTWSAAYLYTIENNLTNTDPGFIDEASGVFALRDDSPAYSIPGFSRIPWEQIGLLDLSIATRGIPLDGAIDQSTSLNLYWGPAFEAASHKVYIGTNASAVQARSIGCYLGEVTSANMMGLSLSEGTTYYWTVDEFDSSGQPMGSGDIWSFTTSGGPIVLGDVTGDSKVDLDDFAKVASYWQATGCVAPFACDQTDFDNSGTVDIDDLLYLIEHWLDTE